MSSRPCPRCLAENPPDEMFCLVCGTPLEVEE